MPSLIVSCYAVFSGYPFQECSFLKGNGRIDLGERGSEGGWEEGFFGGVDGRETGDGMD